jgi:predicted permease
MGEFFRRLYYLINRRRFDRELESDMEFHREMAAREGRRNFGNTLRLREQSREAWGWTWIDHLLQDLRYARRILWRSPGFTLTAVLVLAVGIGVNITAFSIFNLMALKPLPVRDPDTLVRLQRRSPEITTSVVPYPSVLFYREHAKTLSTVIAMMGARLNLEDDAQPLKTNFVTANFFSELGVSAARGRLLDPARDEAFDAPPVVVMGYEFWQRRFDADPSVVGRVVRLNRKAVTVIGVAPEGFSSLNDERADLWLPVTQQPYFVDGSTVLTNIKDGSVSMWARLAPGVTAKMAEKELLALTNERRKQFPKDIWDKEYIRSDPAGHMQVIQPEAYQAAAMVGALTLLILAVSCANLGGLMIARGVAREHEIGIRIAIGAGRKRIFRQLFTESLLLALLGSFCGLLLSYVAMRVIFALTDPPKWMNATPDWRVMLFAMSLAFVAALFFGFAPALQIARQRQRKTIARQILVGAQIAASCVLLIVSGLLVHAVLHMLYTDPGFGYEQVLAVDPQLDQHGYTATTARVYIDELKSGLQALPGVTSVAMSRIPLLGEGYTSYMTVGVRGHSINIYPNCVDSSFFKTMGIPLLHGRNILPGETNAVIVSESLARKQWPGEDPVGKPLWPDGPGKDIIVGVAGNARVKALNDGEAVEAYWPAQQSDMPGMTLLIKTEGTPDDFVPRVKAIAKNMDPKLFPSLWLLKSGFRTNTLALERLAMIVSMLGLVAMLIAGVGIVGLVAYTVSQRGKEIAIRIALGARPLHVLSVILQQFLAPVALGLLAGAALATGISQFLHKILYGVSHLDPAGYAGGIAVLIAIAALAMLLPARRALLVDPARALHEE